MAKKTRQDKWNEAVSQATVAVQDLLDMQDDYQAKYDELTEEQQGDEMGLAYVKITDLDLQGALDTLNEAVDIELP